MHIVDLDPDDAAMVLSTATVLQRGFRGHCPDYEAIDDALATVRESVGEGRLSRVARDDAGRVVGWIGGINQYNGHVWEIHPLVVDPDSQEGGVGRALIEDLERLVGERGAETLWLGTDDEDGRTSLSGVDLYPDPLSKLDKIENHRGHPLGFYLRLGFAVVGCLPDANGFGKPDIFMAKRVVKGKR